MDLFRPTLRRLIPLFVFSVLFSSTESNAADSQAIKVRSILSNNCFHCHGPDKAERQAGLRLDDADGSRAELDSGERAIVPGQPDASELIARITTNDVDLVMPPHDSGKTLTSEEKQLLRDWIKSGAKYARHWAYEKPVRPQPPQVSGKFPVHNPIDQFVQQRQIQENLNPAPPADRYSLARRLALDLTGLPLTPEEADAFANDKDPRAYENLVDQLLQRSAYGEHWARMWLDLARYADSAGYADDPPRTIWGYRDWVIRAINDNMPFDQFTIEQLAGDLLPNPTTDQLVATAFHRNTLTNNEGGTQDEEFRNVAVVDRVNTTMAVWMGTTIACAQCHNHKYDPISQKEYFQLFAILNNTEDRDRRDEAPRVDVFTKQQESQRETWKNETESLRKKLATPTPSLAKAQTEWEATLRRDIEWKAIVPKTLKATNKTPLRLLEDGSVLAGEKRAKDTYQLTFPLEASGLRKLTALQLQTRPHPSLPAKGTGFGGGNFVISQISAAVVPPKSVRQQARFVRIELPGKRKFLSLAEVQVFSGSQNVALKGKATQHSTDFGGPPQYAIDGNTSGIFAHKSTTHTASATAPWWEVDLGGLKDIDRIVVWNRLDGVESRLANFHVIVLNEQRGVVSKHTIAKPPKPNVAVKLSNARPLNFTKAVADFSQPGFDASGVLSEKNANKTGWAIGGQTNRPHTLTLLTDQAVDVPAGSTLQVTIAHNSPHEHHTLGHFKVQTTNDSRAADFARISEKLLAIARTAKSNRSEKQADELAHWFRNNVAAELKPVRERLAKLEKQIAGQKPGTSVPVMRQLAANKLRKTFIQLRGNYLAKGDEVSPGLPEAFGLENYTKSKSTPDRLTLAKWVVDPNNPLTARVIANRYWESIFGRGLVATSEEFGAQGELPSHPELLDWLATELVRLNWDTRAFVKMLVMSATYRQSSVVNSEMLDADPDNRFLARGPRFRMSAEMIRDQALFVSGLLSDRMYGPPVKPPQPQLSVKAAFGGGIDWKTSAGEDKYRRGLYTTWRRSNPYPSMVAFDAPSRQVCTIRRSRTNTPLQALVTLNDPVYIEAAQALARKSTDGSKNDRETIIRAFRACLVRPPADAEITALSNLFSDVRARFTTDAKAAKEMATMPLGPAPDGANEVDLAAWTVVCNVILNLDEMFLKR